MVRRLFAPLQQMDQTGLIYDETFVSICFSNYLEGAIGLTSYHEIAAEFAFS